MKKQWEKLLEWESLIIALFSLILLIFQHNLLNLLYIALLLVSVLFMYKRYKRLSHTFNIIVLPYIFFYVYSDCFNLLLKSLNGLETILYIIYFLGMLALLIPVTIHDYGTIKHPIWQLLASIWIIVNLFLAPVIKIDHGQFIMGLNRSELLLALVFLEYTYFVVKGWGYRFTFNLKVKAHVFYYLLLLVLLAVTVWISFFNTFILSATDWGQALWRWDFSLIKLTDSATMKNIWQLLFSTLDAGIMEESARYIFLLTLLVMFAKRKGQAAYSILLSSAIFSLLHIFNFSTPGTTVNVVLFQVLHAFGFGCLLGTILLYSGKLWLTILLHAFADFLTLSLTPLGYGGSLLDNPHTGVIALIIVTFVPLIFTVFVLLNNNAKKQIYKNINLLIEF